MEEKIIEILKQVMETEAIDANSNQNNTEAWDSMHQLILVSELEDAFDVRLEPEEIAEMKSIQEIVKLIGTKI